MRRARASVLALLLLALGVLPCTAAEEPVFGPLSFEELGRPARRDAVEAALDRAREASSADRLHLCTLLEAAGGVEAARGLEVLMRTRDDDLRTAVLRAATTLGLRRERLRRAARTLADARAEGLRATAVAALGVLGDGRDVPFLLEIADDRRAPSPVRRAAFRALRALSGLRIPYDAGRWRTWWRLETARDGRLLPDALDAVEADPSGPAVERALRVLERNGWVELAVVEAAVGAWFAEPDPDLRRAACRLVGALRLADRVEDVARAHVFDVHGRYADASRACLERLGAPVE